VRFKANEIMKSAKKRIKLAVTTSISKVQYDPVAALVPVAKFAGRSLAHDDREARQQLTTRLDTASTAATYPQYLFYSRPRCQDSVGLLSEMVASQTPALGQSIYKHPMYLKLKHSRKSFSASTSWERTTSLLSRCFADQVYL